MAIAPQLDVLGYLRDASRTGAAIGAQMFNNTLRMQQLQSEQALQRLREQQMAQELAFKLEAHDMEVQRRADMTKALARVQTATSPTIPLQLPRTEGMSPMILPPGPDGMPQAEGMAPPLGVPETVEVPNPNAMPLEDALGTFVLPVIFQHDRTGREGFDALANIARMKQERESAVYQPGFGQAVNPETGQPETFFRTSPRSSQLVPQPQIVHLPDSATGESVAVLQQGRVTKNLPQQSQIQRRMATMALHRQAMEAPGLSEPNPDAPEDMPGMRRIAESKWDQFAKLKGITPSTRTDIEKEMKATDAGLAVATDALQLILSNPDATGVGGLTKDILGRASRQLGIPDDPRITNVRTRLAQAFTQLAPSMRVDTGNMNRYELEQLKNVGDPVSWKDDEQAAADKMQGIMDLLVAKKIREVKALGQQPSDAILVRIPLDQIKRMFHGDALSEDDLDRLMRLKRITPAQALEVWKTKPKAE